MCGEWMALVVAALIGVNGAAVGAEPPAASLDALQDGVLGFPGAQAVVLCDTPTLRVGAASDAEHLYVQAILFEDGDDSVGEAEDGRAIGDWSVLCVDADGDGKATGDVDRNYTLNPWPVLPGLHYSIVFDERGSSGLLADSKGRGAISYVPVEGDAAGRRVRVDSYLIPLAEIGRKPGETVRLAYWGSSAKPAATVNSVGFTREGKYYSFHLPRESWHALTLGKGAPVVLDAQAVPEGRETIALEAKAPKAMPEVGAAPPEVNAVAWLNWPAETAAPSLTTLEGKVIAVEFWATWCGPCVAGIPHLNEVYAAHRDEGLVILSLTDQSRVHVEEFMKGTPMHYPVGVKSTTLNDYGVTGIPHAFVVGRDGKLRWHGHPADAEFEESIQAALAEK